ncbi:MAG TPA: Hsp20/alpha crystallin family protein [Acidimicrobiia bacterium]|nr:Hsp20/alpha crystallin family protein [Acidimicrobiia bacterium]
MAISRWAPFSALTSLEREMQNFERELHSLLGRIGGAGEEVAWRPDTDVYREGETLVVRAELPGIEPDKHLEIDVEDNILRIRGHKRLEREIDEEHRFVRECRFGSFQRDILLPDGVEASNVEAVYENGVLTVRVPVPAGAAGGTKIPIKVEARKTPASKIAPD